MKHRHRLMLLGTAAALAASVPASAQQADMPAGAGTPSTPAAPQTQGAEEGAPQVQGPGGAERAPVETDQSGLQDIVITATRSATNLQKTPIAITAVTTDQLQGRGVTRLEDIGQFSPSFSSGVNGGRVAIRGIGVDTNASQSSVGVYVDEVFYVGANNIGLYDIDRVEILRGPQGTLFGRNTIGGAIQYVSRKPTDRFEGYIDAIGGSYSRHDFQGAINVPIVDGLALRIAGNSQDRAGYVRDLGNGDRYGEIRQRQARAILRWQPVDRMTIDLQGQYYKQHANGRPVVPGLINPNAQFAGLARAFGETRPLTQAYAPSQRYALAGFNAPDFSRSNFRQVQSNIAFGLTDNVEFKSITAYARLTSRMAQDFDLTPLAILAQPAPVKTVTRLITQENQLIGRFLDQRLRVTLGYYLFDSKAYTIGAQGVVIGLRQQPSGGDNETDIQADAFYGQATFNVTEQLSITGGLRYSREENVAFNRLGTRGPLSSKFSDTSPYAGINFQAHDDMLFYAKYSKGFKAGGQVVNTNLPGGNLPFGPEKADTYEAGARLQFFDRRLRINPTYFYTKWNDIQFNLLIPLASTVVTATQNAGSAIIKGFEIEAQIAPTSRLLVSLAASFNDSYYREVPALTRTLYLSGFPGPGTVQPNITRDSELNRSPRTRITGDVRYTLPLTSTTDLTVNFSGVHTSSQFAGVTLSDQIFLPKTTIFQARGQLDFADRKYSLAVFATNLFNDYYITSGIGFGRGYTVGVDELTPARPREFGVQGTVRF